MNDVTFLLQPPRKDLLNALGKGVASATDIAHSLKLSVAHVATQLKLLEAHGIIVRTIQRKKKVGKPQATYAIAREEAAVVIIAATGITSYLIPLTNQNKFLYSTMAESEEHRYFLHKLYYSHDGLLQEADIIAKLDSTKTETNLLLITKNVEKIRKEHSTIRLSRPDGKEHSFIIWSHTKEEIEGGVQRAEPYFIDKITTAIPLWDKHSDFTLQKLKKMLPAR